MRRNIGKEVGSREEVNHDGGGKMEVNGERDRSRGERKHISGGDMWAKTEEENHICCTASRSLQEIHL